MDQQSNGDVETLADSGFYWREKAGLKLLVCSPLERAGFVNGFSTRVGGVSPFPENSLNLAGFDEDSEENIYENRRRFQELFKGEYRLATAWQVHGNGIKIVRNTSDIDNSEQKFDGLIASGANILAGVKTADCVPVLIGDPVTRAFAAVHAGWRGTSLSIVVRAIETMRDEFGSKPVDMIAAIGPAASGRNYEIGQDVIEAFRTRFKEHESYFVPTREGHALVDLHLANTDQLISTGMPRASIYTAPYCTMERTDLFFSYRIEKRSAGKTGRLLSVIGLA